MFVSDRDVRADLASVRIPSMLVWGERDRLLPTPFAEERQRFLRGSPVVLLPCGHVPMWEAADQPRRC
jgi:pimeloyl-ACP methyl ester carboxylesterase